PPIQRTGRGRRVGQERLVDVDPGVDLARVQRPIAEGPGHVRIHLGDDQGGPPRGGERDTHGYSEAQVAVGVRRGRVHEHAVGRPPAARHELGDEIEVADGYELHATPAARLFQPWGHVPG